MPTKRNLRCLPDRDWLSVSHQKCFIQMKSSTIFSVHLFLNSVGRYNVCMRKVFGLIFHLNARLFYMEHTNIKLILYYSAITTVWSFQERVFSHMLIPHLLTDTCKTLPSINCLLKSHYGSMFYIKH